MTKVSEALSRHVSEKCVEFGLRLIKAATQERTDRAQSQLPPLDKVVAPLACPAVADLMVQNALNQVQKALCLCRLH